MNPNTTKGVFTVEDIHELRVRTAEKYAKMSSEEAEKDFRSRVEGAKKIMESIREQKRQKTYTN